MVDEEERNSEPERAAESAMKEQIARVLAEAQVPLLLDQQRAARAVTQAAPSGVIVTRERYGYYARGQRLPPTWLVPAICEALSITPQLLLGMEAEGNMSADEVQLLRWYRRITTSTLREMVLAVARSNASIARKLVPDKEGHGEGSDKPLADPV